MNLLQMTVQGILNASFGILLAKVCLPAFHGGYHWLKLRSQFPKKTILLRQIPVLLAPLLTIPSLFVLAIFPNYGAEDSQILFNSISEKESSLPQIVRGDWVITAPYPDLAGSRGSQQLLAVIVMMSDGPMTLFFLDYLDSAETEIFQKIMILLKDLFPRFEVLFLPNQAEKAISFVFLVFFCRRS
jgi:hypothetical protein